ncbi:MAG: hypothetical protein HBSAPP03_22230 [Phycisphaerae bacterium]|nr:MAG: hypothetical protein HBSAPP03_22230 [Phycisphaerae bacterium]
MTGVLYSVSVTLPEQAMQREFVAWLTQGHVQAVRRGGAIRATIVTLDEPAMSPRVIIHYEFPDRPAFDRYLREVAPALREEGRRRFGPERGVEMTRTVGTIQFDSGDVHSASSTAFPQVREHP